MAALFICCVFVSVQTPGRLDAVVQFLVAPGVGPVTYMCTGCCMQYADVEDSGTRNNVSKCWICAT